MCHASGSGQEHAVDAVLPAHGGPSRTSVGRMCGLATVVGSASMSPLAICIASDILRRVQQGHWAAALSAPSPATPPGEVSLRSQWTELILSGRLRDRIQGLL